jgi:hypothetical protein
MDEEKLKEYRKRWKERIQLLLDHKNKLNSDELKYISGFDKYLNDRDELSRKQSKTLNNIYERFLGNI